MITPSKYSKWYSAIINNAKSEIRSKKIDYFENHHINPRSLGGKNNKENTVLLTAREHFICHQLLIKMFPTNSREHRSMVFAFKRMTCFSKFHSDERAKVLKSRYFETFRKLHSKAMSALSKENWKNPEYRAKLINALSTRIIKDSTREARSKSMQGHLVSSETRLKISQSKKGKDNGWSGRTHSPESKLQMSKSAKIREMSPMKADTKIKISQANKGRKWSNETKIKRIGEKRSPESRLKMSQAHLGKKISDEQKKKQSDALKGRKFSPEHLAKLKIAAQLRASKRSQLA